MTTDANGGGGSKLRRAAVPRNRADVEDKNFDEIAKYEIRIRIAARVGFNRNPRYEFSLREWNAIYAYITGGYYFPMREYNTPLSPDIADVRAAALGKAGAVDGHPDVEPGATTDGEWDPENGPRKAQLAALCETLEEQGDSRPRPSGGG